MGSNLQKLSFHFGIPGLALHLLGVSLLVWSHLIGNILLFTGFFLMVIGVIYYVRSKGRHWAWSFLILLDLIGLIVLFFLEDHEDFLRL